MQNNGMRLLSLALFLALSLYYLYPTLRNAMYQNTLDGLDAEAQEEYEREHYAAMRSVEERALNLGLDLQGGMFVTLEVRVSELMRALAESTDPAFDAALAAANEEMQDEGSTQSYIDAFLDAFEQVDPNYRLSRYYRDTERGITRRSSNDDVAEYLRAEASAAVDRAIEIIRQRVDRFGVSEPSIQKQGTRRVVVELPGVDDAERVRDLLRNTARLEFRLMPDPEEMNSALQAVVQTYESMAAEEVTDEDAALEDGMDADSTEMAAALPDSSAADSADADTAETESLDDLLADFDPEAAEGNSLLQIFQPAYGGVMLGYVAEADTALARELLFAPEVRNYWPNDFELMWSSKPIGQNENGFDVYEALAVRENIELTGDAIENASPQFDELNRPQVSMEMDSEGAAIWSRLTGANIGNPVAIVMDNVVFSYPVVQGKIAFGRSEITNLDSQMEQEDLVTLLKSGALPAPVDIVAERTVGPSLGAESIRAGTISLVVGILLVCVFMFVYYRTAGLVADMALLLNVLFIFGILAGFHATLTLPGIAGIVLTIGMAVDANVLIFERVREEQSTGKTMKAAIAGGYSNALSAILDANITTFLVAAILYSFGKGPIQGFAVTLMAGIVSSLFTAIICTRIVFDWLVVERKRLVSFG